MNRRRFLTNGALATGALIVRSTANGQEKPATVLVHADEPLGAIAPDFMGLGFEISSVSRTGLLSPSDSVYVQLVRTLGARGVIRVGGNTSDYSRYAPGEPPVSKSFGSVVNDAVLQDLGGFLKATGWKLIWGLNLGRSSEADAVAEAKAVLSYAGSNLLAFEIGNEPDLFGRAKHRRPEYSYDDWLAEYRRYKAALRARFPQIPFAGPDVAGKTDWVTRFADDEGRDIVLLTHHYYREGQNPTSSIEKLLGVDPKLQRQLDQLRAASTKCGVPYRICEVNSFSGGGRPGVSDTMAGALWVLDYMFTLASGGCAGVNMETGVNQLEFVSSYSPIGDDEKGHYSAKPEYYGMLAFSLAGKGSLVKTEIDTASPEMKAYATLPKQGPLTLTLINKGTTASRVTVKIGSRKGHQKASTIRLGGPAIDAKIGITLGGVEISPTGMWIPRPAETLRSSVGQFIIELPAASAAMMQFV